jgi:hypothetical protein
MNTDAAIDARGWRGGRGADLLAQDHTENFVAAGCASMSNGFQKVIADNDCHMIQRVWNSEIRRDEWESMYSLRREITSRFPKIQADVCKA